VCLYEASLECVRHGNLKTIADVFFLLGIVTYGLEKKSHDMIGQSQGHCSEGSRSLGKVMNYSVAGSEIPSLMASFAILFNSLPLSSFLADR